MATKYLVTGAAGFLGGHIVRELLSQGESVRVLTLPGDRLAATLPAGIELLEGDVRSSDDLRRFFDLPKDTEAVVIHAAGIVTIWPGFDQRVYDVNVEGTRNVVQACVQHGVKKLVHVASVHALTEPERGVTIREQTSFEPKKLVGLYGQTKAQAAQIVMDAVEQDGLNASIVFPAGLCGPGDFARGHMTQLLTDCAMGRLPAGVRGGYDFTDVRDVAKGIILAAKKAGAGENFILSNRYVSVEEILRLVHEQTGTKLVRTMLPVWAAEAAVPFLSMYYKVKKRKPLFTRYSLYTLTSNCDFCNEKARTELGYAPRPFEETVADTLEWLRCERFITARPKRRPLRLQARKKRRSV